MTTAAAQARIAAHLAARYAAPKPSPLAARNPVVYYLQLDQLVKIGTTLNLPARLRALPFDRVLATEPGYYDLEGQRHRQFAHLRHRGEWFRAAPELLDFIGTLDKCHGASLAHRAVT